MVKKDKNYPVYRQDITMSIDREYCDRIKELCIFVKEELDEICEQYVFQAELTGAENYHLQVRVNLKSENRWRCKQLQKHLKTCFPVQFYNIYCTPTSTNAKSNFSYVMKAETRIEGPFANIPIFLGKSILSSSQLTPWQEFFVGLLKAYDKSETDYRSIYHVLDRDGNNMKSSFVRHMLFNYPNEVGLINPFGSPGQINASVVKMGPRRMYILDLPRSYSWETTNELGMVVRKYYPQFQELMIIIERIKDGTLIDTYYGKHEVLLIDPPILVVISNWELESYPGQKISADRLKTIDLAEQDPLALVRNVQLL